MVHKICLFKELDYSETFSKAFFYIKIIVKEVSCLVKCIVFLALSICQVCIKTRREVLKRVDDYLGGCHLEDSPGMQD